MTEQVINNQSLTYNTERGQLIIAEYGRTIQEMVDYVCNLADKTERTNAAKTVVKVMSRINPNLHATAEEYEHKLWDHLYIMSRFKLDVDAPYPCPDKEPKADTVEKPSYNHQDVEYRHFGKYITAFIRVAGKVEDEEERMALTMMIANMMKKSYLTWHKDSVQDEKILEDLRVMSKGTLNLADDTALQNTQQLFKVKRKFKNFKNKKKKGRN
ncbi:MAG: DUF4290 domain-containing protein [Flavobacteriales bacterium]|nr:DUF4290 domain-containing protein [Flavobacteriales bacterium]